MVKIINKKKQRKLKKIIRELVGYHITETGGCHLSFLEGLKDLPSSPDLYEPKDWHYHYIKETLLNHGGSVSYCIENKDILRRVVLKEESQSQGEFYTPLYWVQEGHKYLKEKLGEKWGDYYIWDASCGTGNLFAGLDYPVEKLFMSTLLEEDVLIAKERYKGACVFQLDFLKGIDFDKYNTLFSNQLPLKLQEVLQENKPLIILMNPPYYVKRHDHSDIGLMMSQRGLAKCALDINHQFMYRLILLKDFYNLTSTYLALYGKATIFVAGLLKSLYEEFQEVFSFEGGFCFSSAEFSCTKATVPHPILFTTWKSKKKLGIVKKEPFYLDVKTTKDVQETEGRLYVGYPEETLQTWVKDKTITEYESTPVITNYLTFKKGKQQLTGKNAIGYMCSADYVPNGVRFNAVSTLPLERSLDITKENFDRVVASVVARLAYASMWNPYENIQYFSKPDTSKEGYTEWEADALLMFIFSRYNIAIPYRGIEGVEGGYKSNHFFPLSSLEVKDIVTDPRILEDLLTYPNDNSFILDKIEKALKIACPEAKAFFSKGLELTKNTLKGYKRHNLGYEGHTVAWDSSFSHLRRIKGMYELEDLKVMFALEVNLKKKLQQGVYKYGFIIPYKQEYQGK